MPFAVGLMPVASCRLCHICPTCVMPFVPHMPHMCRYAPDCAIGVTCPTWACAACGMWAATCPHAHMPHTWGNVGSHMPICPTHVAAHIAPHMGLPHPRPHAHMPICPTHGAAPHLGGAAPHLGQPHTWVGQPHTWGSPTLGWGSPTHGAAPHMGQPYMGQQPHGLGFRV
jgi:hypothetical protein